MAKNYLDKTGLARLWGRIQDLYLSKTTYENHTLDMNATINNLDIRITENTTNIGNKQNKITYGTEEPTGGVSGDVYLMPISEDSVDKVGDLSTLTTTDKSCAVAAINEVKNKHIITARLIANYTLTASSIYETLPLQEWTKVGDKLSVNSNGEVVIGAGVHHIKITGNARNTTGTVAGKYVTIQNSNSQQLVQSIVYKPVANQTIMVPLAPATFEVSEGERLSLRVYGAKGDVWVGNSQTYGMLATYMTIEVVD